MGGGKRFPYPKYVWSPTGGWWCQPLNWKRNTVIAAGAVFLVCLPVFYLSASRERMVQSPYRHVFSQRFSRYSKEDDPTVPDSHRIFKW